MIKLRLQRINNETKAPQEIAAFLKKRKIFTKAQKKRSEEGRVLAAGRLHLPAVAVYWMNESCEDADIERWAAGEC